MGKFSDMSAEEQNAIITKIGDLLVKHKIPADVKTIQEVVCNVKGKEIEHNVSLVVKKELPPSMKDSADAFNKEAKEITEGIEGASISATCVVGAGQKYQVI